MTNFRVVVSACAVLLTGSLAYGQDAPTYVWGTYYRCDVAKEARTDAIFKETIAPLWQKQVEAGRITGYGWNRHWLGGSWRRLGYIAGTSLDAMVEAGQQVIAEIQKQPAGGEFVAICGSHDDYIWQVADGSPAPPTPAATTMSTYFRCESNEAEADAILKATLAPVLNQHVKEGKIASWEWLEHEAGGPVRRVLVLGAADHTTLLTYWASLDQALATAQPELARRFSSICFSHSDYIWDRTVR